MRVTWRTGSRIGLALVLVLCATPKIFAQASTPAPPQVSAPVSAVPQSPKPAASSADDDSAIAPTVIITAVRVLTDVVERAKGEAADQSAPGLMGAATGVAGLASATEVPVTTPRSKLLVSSADLEVTVPAKAYDEAVAYKTKHKADLKLFVNGVDASSAATLFAQIRKDDSALLRYHLAGGSAAQTLWKPLYRQSGLTGESPLELTLGWSATGPSGTADPRATADLRIAVAPAVRQLWAVVLLVAVLLISIVVLVQTDTFRDPAPPWLETYRQNLAEYERADAAGQTALLRKIEPNYLVADALSYKAVAQRVIDGQPAVSDGMPQTAVGMLLMDLSGKSTPVLKPTFSLSRLQMGLWFLFATCTGLFLWVVYGELATITGSLLVILGISVGTTGAAIAAQPDGAKEKSTLTKGMLKDVVTGLDQTQHVHRYQSVIVNLLLLVVGAYYVMTELAFPVFDSTWLVFLGVSGATFAGGKQVLEQAKAPTAH